KKLKSCRYLFLRYKGLTHVHCFSKIPIASSNRSFHFYTLIQHKVTFCLSMCHRRLAKAGDCAPKALTSVGAFGFYIPLDMKVFAYARVSTKGQRFDA